MTVSPQNPAQAALYLPGVHAYATEKSIHAGEEIGFFVSSDAPYRMTISKPSRIDEDAEQDVIHLFDAAPANVQPITPGSYVFVKRGLPARQTFDAFSVELWVRPWEMARRQALISQFDYPGQCGFGLFLDEVGQVEFYLGSGGEYQQAGTLTGIKLDRLVWHHLVATSDGQTLALWVNGVKVASQRTYGPFRGGAAPIRISASSIDGVAQQFGDVDILMPALYGRALLAEEIARRHAERGRRPPVDRSVLACWPMYERLGDRIQDGSGHRRTGQLINHPAWMIIGPDFDPAKVGVFGDTDPPYDPFTDPERGYGMRFARDDLYDCGWRETQRFRIPADAAPGIYVARLRFDYRGAARRYDVTFIVKRAKGHAIASMLVLCAINTWLAYGTTSFPDSTDLESVWPRRGVGLCNSHPEAPRFSTYTAHLAGQPSYFKGLRTPWPNASPNARYDPSEANFGQWARLEIQLHLWLEQNGYTFDIVTDLDLDREPEMLDDYQVLLINGHSEYWTTPAYDGVDRYLCNGGAVIVLSGNSISGRVSYDDDGTIMECRHTQLELGFVPGTDIPFPGGPHGEQYHSQDWSKGDMLRRAGRSSANIIGLESAGWAFATAEDFGVYQVELPEHFLFNTPHRVGLTKGETFGHGPGGSLPRAIGHEWDLTTRTLKSMVRQVPPGASMPADQEGISVIATGVRSKPGPLDAYFDVFVQESSSSELLSCEMIYWERPEGGRVFNAGAVGANWVLGIDQSFDLLLKNVLYHFGQAPG